MIYRAKAGAGARSLLESGATEEFVQGAYPLILDDALIVWVVIHEIAGEVGDRRSTGI